VGERIIETRQLKGEEAHKIRTLFADELWSKFFKSTKDDGNSCSVENVCGNFQKLGKKCIQDASRTIVGLYFDTVDKDNDGFVDQNDFRNFFYVLGIPENLSVLAFQSLDVDKDGLVSKEDFVKAGIDFVTLEEEYYPSDNFLGPL